MTEIFRIARFLRECTAFPVALATLVSVGGSSYRRTGARRVISPNGSSLGAISGGCLEQDLQTRAFALLKSSNNSELVTYDTKSENDLLWGTGTGCHGVVKILLERVSAYPEWAEHVLSAQQHRRVVYLQTNWGNHDSNSGTRGSSPSPETGHQTLQQIIEPTHRVVVFGAGDDAVPLSHFIRDLGWEHIICDPRKEFATSARFPAADLVKCCPVDHAVTEVDWDDHTVAVVMTHHYRYDLPLLKVLVPMQLPYLGLLGPKERGERLLRDAGFDPQTAGLHNPIGLDLGGDGSEAVALSIVAEIQAHLHRRNAQPLRNRTKPMHDV